ncbi:hypothetical protein SAMD00019534_110740 [Acytostelium subglobosum LB1]|uniref:hypothetical protein n=1 Tax=Acytostelium subglobosum LB1 TaxID=1410327 RepID=UPI0006449D78|nr:hypothetical protein SAMD00019534_110740 [Acytostelium subglobosum LB1]GAM27898.1 hypothetical protein SAMD00019534_110740 [Acytostelium subglobosum LB1]|eukprot:XP_012749181.1 hypothetical protein SAMD00019534_110740 [Acytostelium subglobosum LB1]
MDGSSSSLRHILLGTIQGHIWVGVAIATLLALHGLRKKSLNMSGAIAAWFTGLITFTAGHTFAAILIAFYLSSSYLTKYKASIKKKLEEDHKVGGQRNYIQVFSNSLVGTVLALAHMLVSNSRWNTYIDSRYPLDVFLLCAFVGQYACCNGDTWASELGILNKTQPILITKLRRVPPGTNGAISPLGTFASLMGGLFIGVCYYVLSILFAPANVTAHQPQYPIILLASFSGICGSMIDSLLGATVQYSGWDIKNNKVTNIQPKSKNNLIAHLSGADILDNHQVNFLSCLSMSIISGCIGYCLL